MSDSDVMAQKKKLEVCLYHFETVAEHIVYTYGVYSI